MSATRIAATFRPSVKQLSAQFVFGVLAPDAAPVMERNLAGLPRAMVTQIKEKRF
jgi:hypothetical protein